MTRSDDTIVYEPIHRGEVMAYDPAIGERHCNTVLPNHGCPYLEHHCGGCTIVDWTPITIGDIKRRAAKPIEVQP